MTRPFYRGLEELAAPCWRRGSPPLFRQLQAATPAVRLPRHCCYLRPRVAMRSGVEVTLDSRHLRTPNQSHTRTVLSLLVVSVLSSRHRRAGRKSARSLSSASRLSGIDCDPHVRELITVESYVATVADQGKHPGVVEHDVGLQVGHATCRRGGNNGAEQVASQPPTSPARGNGKGELTVAVRQDSVARLGNQCVLGAGNDRDQAVSA